MDQNSSNSKPRGRDSDGEIQHQQPSKPSTRRLTVQIPSRQKSPMSNKRSNPKDSDQDDEESSGEEQNRAKRRKKDRFDQDRSNDYTPLEGDDDSKPEKVPGEDGDVVFDDLWTLDDESNLVMSWSEDDQTLLDSLPKAEIALWRRSMRLFGVGPEELFPPNVTISRADLPDYVGNEGREIPNTIHLTTKFCDTFKYIISLPLLAKRRSLIQYLLTKALRLRCGDRCTVPESFETHVMDMDITELLETLRHAGIIGNLTRGQERIFRDSLGEHFPEHFHFHKHLKHFVKANSGMKPQKASKNASANEDEGFGLGHDGRISNDEEDQNDDPLMVDDEPFGMGMVSGSRSPTPPGPSEAQIIGPLEVLAGPECRNLPNIPSLRDFLAPDEAIDSKSVHGCQHTTILPNAIAKYEIQQSLDEEDNTLVRISNKPMGKNALGTMVRLNLTQLKILKTEAYTYLSK
ncbi:62ed174d-506a-4592-82a7-c130d1c1e047 [Sclerotinia trifoliorum]|uniref:62ed174d-506a-4592-82a7-c130d1c1e047 n=1 Tax=Sclerotinia trifoliorum TaxID=28548 RepID=A0A8H2VNU3_9HELO|nr:62ed174d-506a-4592-82a7-c130d1c1e047 [Sclerotinia trifoliorum]